MNYLLNMFNYNENKINFIFLILLFLYSISIFTSTAFYQIAFGFIVLFFIWHITYYKNFNNLANIAKENKIMTILFICFTLFLAFSTLINQEFASKKSNSHVILFILRYAVIFILLLYFYYLDYFSKYLLIKLLLLGSLMVIIGGIYEAVFSDEDIHSIKGYFADKNPFGFFCGLGFLLSINYINKNNIKLILLMVMLLFLALSFSRAAWVATMMATIFYYMFIKKINKYDIVVIFSIVIGIAILYNFYEPFQHRVSDLINAKGAGRENIWKFCIEKIKLNPIFGYGMDSFQKVSNGQFYYGGLVTRPHNLELHLLFDTGICGFIPYFMMIIYSFYHALKNKKWQILTILIYFFVIMQFDYTPHMSSRQLSILSIILFLLFSRDDTKENK